MSDFSLLTTLRQMPYFIHVAEPHLNLLAQHAFYRSFTSGTVIFLEGDPSAGLWILESGRVKAYKLSPDGQEYILRFFGPGDTFNDLAALDNASNAASTMAVTDVSAWVISTIVFTEALQADHELSLAVIQGLVGRVRHLVGRMEDLALKPVIARLAHFLLEQVENPTLAHPAVTRMLIASHLATTPESVSRSLRVLEEAGAIRFDRHRIIVIRPDILRHQANL
ncbi:MAG: Crp/Fnr family transcriptional regulator [Anaerolineales bacterium]|nr:Crp/Fnr family transcriptional regulator [Anaerolineales bacterium]MCB0026601.1 Crp/Fnr family transcriptional regulator [Anaerolineales bacterium]